MSLDFQPCTNNLSHGSWLHFPLRKMVVQPNWDFCLPKIDTSLVTQHLKSPMFSHKFALIQLLTVALIIALAVFPVALPSSLFRLTSLPCVRMVLLLPSFGVSSVMVFILTKLLSLNIPVSGNVDFLEVLTAVQIDSVSLKGLKQITKYNKQLLDV